MLCHFYPCDINKVESQLTVPHSISFLLIRVLSLHSTPIVLHHFSYSLSYQEESPKVLSSFLGSLYFNCLSEHRIKPVI
ncbi:hypothetical protein IC582_014418 [Cucumis melo]